MTVLTTADVAAGIARFAEGCAAIEARRTGSAQGLAVFFEAAGPMLTYRRRRTPVVADPVMFAEAMAAIASPLRLARDAGVFADPWKLAGLKRREVANAGVLAGLWRPTSSGKIAIDYLAAFFDRVRSRPGGEMLPDWNALCDGYIVRTEDRPMGEAAERVDITIEGRNFLVGIEVKIDAGLQPDQLGRYQAAIGQRAAGYGRQATVIFLARRQTGHSGVVNAGWNDVAAAARTVLSKNGAARDVNHHLIERFAAHVAHF